MGKGMMNGLVIYRDLFDQKGPYLYLLYGLAYLISNKTFLGVYLFEILAAAGFLGFSYKIIRLYVSEFFGLLSIPFLGAVVYSSKSFYWGGAAEEFCLPLLALSLWLILRYFGKRDKKCPDTVTILTIGICAGIIMFVKYIMLGFYIGAALSIIIWLIYCKDFKGLLKTTGLFLLGILITFIPWLLYFGVNGALGDWYTAYVYNNVFIYNGLSKEDVSFSRSLYENLVKRAYYILIDNRVYPFFIMIGTLGAFADRKRSLIYKIGLFLMEAALFTGIFIGGGSVAYYAIPLMVFVPVGFGYLLMAIGRICGYVCDKRITSKSSIFRRRAVAGVLCSVSVLFGAAVAYSLSENVFFMKYSKNDIFIYEFADIIEQDGLENPTLTVDNCLDPGLYLETGIVPSTKYFQTNGIGLQEMFNEQQRYISEGVTDYVLTRDMIPTGIEEHYELVSTREMTSDVYDFTYRLYRKVQ